MIKIKCEGEIQLFHVRWKAEIVSIAMSGQHRGSAMLRLSRA